MDVREISLEHVRELASQVFGSGAAAREWLAPPAMSLNRQVPEDLLGTEVGRTLFRTILGQLDYCVYV